MNCGHATRAQASRERRDIVSGQVMDESLLIRFVEGPGGGVLPDLGRKLPGRGVWVAADRSVIEVARKRGLFARALRRKIDVAEHLCGQIESLLMTRLLAALGLARKSGDLVTGFEKAQTAVISNKAALIVEATDGAPDGRRKLMDARRRSSSSAPVIGLFTSDELGLALGMENVVHSAFLAGRGAERWLIEAGRLAGFRPLCPEEWDG